MRLFIKMKCYVNMIVDDDDDLVEWEIYIDYEILEITSI